MSDIMEAKKHLRELYRNEEGFVGVGIGRRGETDMLRVYVVDKNFPVAQKLNAAGTFEGFSLEIQPTGIIQASSE